MEVFILIAFLDGSQSASGYQIEFNSKDTCETAKTLMIEKHKIKPDDGWKDYSWVDCVKK